MKNVVSIRQKLYCPGPVNTHDSVKDAAVENEIGHRQPEFSILQTAIQKKLLNLYGVSAAKGYHAVIVTGSGTAANEAVLSSIVGNKHILVLTNGEFGDRLFDISSLHNRNTHRLRFPWARPIQISRVENYLKNHKVDIIAMVHHETSSSMLNPIKEIGALAAQYGKQFFIDTVSSAGAELIDLKEANVTFCSGSASKALCSLPGVAYVVGQEAAFEQLATLPAKTMYLNLYKFYRYSKDYQQTPNTPAVQSFFAFNQALTNVLSVGLKARHKELLAKAQYLRKGLKSFGFTFLIPEEQMSSYLTTVMLPSNLSMKALYKELKAENIIIYGGKGPLADKVFQVANIGELDYAGLDLFLQAIEKVCTLYGSKPIRPVVTR